MSDHESSSGDVPVVGVEPLPKRSPVELLQEFSIPLLVGVLVAVIWANLDQPSYHHLVHASPFGEGSPLNLHFFANEVLMVFFFGVAAKEITEACLPGGALNPPHKAVNPLMGTIGGIVGPVGVYFLVAWLFGAPEIFNGWGIPTATDIALAWLVARMVFGRRHPAVSFLLLLAVADDAAGLGIIAIFYPDPNAPVEPVWLVLVAVALVIAYLLNRRRVMSFWPYVVIAGGLSWYGLHAAHLHPALALVPVVPFMPNRGADEGLFNGHEDSLYQDTLNRFEHFFKGPVDFGLLTFGLANAGVPFASMGPATWTVLLALLVGKTIGVMGMSGAAHLLGFHLPQGMDMKSLFVTSLIAGLGLTVALFVAGVAFAEPTMQGAGKMGALLSSLAAPLALIAGKLLRVKRKDSLEPGEPEPLINPSGRDSLRGHDAPPDDGDMDCGDMDCGEMPESGEHP